MTRRGVYRRRSMKNDLIIRGFEEPNNSWLGRWFLLQIFDNDTDCDVAEIRAILEVDEE